MKRIHDTIIEEGTEDLPIQKKRTTVRAIIYKNKELLMVYSRDFQDFIFPGGGHKTGEDLMEALKRELMEELGAKSVTDITAYGFMKEKRFGLSDQHTVYLQTSYYYLCQVDDFGEQALEEREIAHGTEPVWISIDEAIKRNQIAIETNHHHKGMKTVLPREIIVLKDIKEYFNA